MNSVYTLNTGPKGIEEGRLDTQHNQFTRGTNGLLPEHIRKHLTSVGDSPAIADVATGTGIWLKDLANELPPGARLDGYDIDTSKFLDRTELPPNVTLSYANALQPFTTQIHGSYDLVHVRLVMFALKAEEWEPVIANLITVLKPGGWLLWHEQSYSSWTCIPMTENFFKWIIAEVKFCLSVGRDPYCGVNLLQRVKDQGFSKVSQEVFSAFALDAESRKACAKVIMAGGRQSMHGMVAKGGVDGVKSHEDADRIADAILEDVENGVCEIGTEIYWVSGQRPGK